MKAKRLIVLLSCFILAACTFACGKESTLTISAETLTVEAGSSAELTATVDDGSDLVWSSDDTAVAYWADGRVHGVSAGTAVITVTAGPLSATCTVTVTAKEQEAPVQRVIALSASSLDLEPGNSDTLTATVYADGTATDETVTWSAEGDCLSIAADGNTVTVTGVSAGTGKVTATCGALTASCTVTVANVHTVSGTLAIADGVRIGTATLADAAVTFTTTGSERRAEVSADGSWSIDLTEGTYTAVASHPNYRSVALGEIVLDGDVDKGTATFSHYGFTGGAGSYNTWTYDEADSTLSMTNSGDDVQGQGAHYLSGSSATQFALSATLDATGPKNSKFGVVFAADDATSTSGVYSVMFSPEQNEVNFYSGVSGNEIFPAYTLYNGAAGTSGGSRINLPSGVLTTTNTEGNTYHFNLDVTVVRDGAYLYLFVGGTFYVRAEMPAAVADTAALVGFRTQGKDSAEISDIDFDMGAEAVTDAIGVDISTGTPQNGSVSVTDGAFLGDDVTITVLPDSGYELNTLTVDGTNVTAQIADNQYTFKADKTAYTVSAEFREIIPRRTVSGTVSIDGGVAITGVSLADATVLFTDTTTELTTTLPVGENGAFSGLVAEGEYTVTFRHPSYRDVVVADFTVSETSVTVDEQTFSHYGTAAGNYDAVKGDNTLWTYDEAGKTIGMSVKPDASAANAISTYYFNNSSATQYVLNAVLTMTGPSTSKFGVVVAAADPMANEAYSLMFSPTQNQLNFYQTVNTSEITLGRTYYNGAYQSPNNTDWQRIALPDGVLTTTQSDTDYVCTIDVTVIRDGGYLYLFVDGVFYLRFELPEEAADTAGYFGFRTQGHSSATVSDISYDLGAAAVAEALAVEISTGSPANGTVTVTGDKVLGESVTIDFAPAEEYELYSVTVDGEPYTAQVSEGTLTLVLEKASYNVEAVFSEIRYQYTVSGEGVGIDPSVFTGVAGRGAELAEVVFTETSGAEERLTVESDGAFSGLITEGTYTVTVTHPDYYDISLGSLTVDGEETVAGDMTFRHYKLGAQLTKGDTACTDWTLDPATDTVTLARSAADITYAALGDAAGTHYVFHATLESQSQANDTKVGFILSWADTSAVGNAVTMVISRSQNQINFYRGGTELQNLARTYYNGAAQTGSNAHRITPPTGYLRSVSGTTSLQPVRVTVVRDNTVFHVWLNGVKMFEVTIPDLDGVAGRIGFRNQNVAAATFTDIGFTMSKDAVAAALTATATFTAEGTGAEVAYEGLSDGSAAVGKNAVRVTLTPEPGRAVTRVTVLNNGAAMPVEHTGAGILVPVLWGGTYTVVYETAATADLVEYSGTLDLAEYYRYDETDNPGTYPAGLAGTDYFQAGLTAGLNAIDYRELVIEFTAADGSKYYAAVDRDYAFTAYLPAGSYTYRAYDIDFYGYWLAGAAQNPALADYVYRLEPATGEFELTEAVTDAQLALTEIGYNASRGTFVSGDDDMYCYNNNTHTESADGRGYNGNFYLGVSEPEIMVSFKVTAGATMTMYFNTGASGSVTVSIGAETVTLNNAFEASGTVTRATEGTETITVIRHGHVIRVYLDGELAVEGTADEATYAGYYMAIAVNTGSNLITDLYTTADAALIAAADTAAAA